MIALVTGSAAVAAGAVALIMLTPIPERRSDAAPATGISAAVQPVRRVVPPPLAAPAVADGDTAPATAGQVTEPQAEPATAEAEPAAPAPPRIAIRYDGSRDNGAALADTLAAALRAQGFEVADTSPAPFGVGRASARYFAPADRDSVNEVNRTVTAFLTGRGADASQVMDMTTNATLGRAGTIEVWLPGTP